MYSYNDYTSNYLNSKKMSTYCSIWLPLAIFLYLAGTATFSMSMYFVLLYTIHTDILIYAYLLVGLGILALVFLYLQITQFLRNRHAQLYPHLIMSMPTATAPNNMSAV